MYALDIIQYMYIYIYIYTHIHELGASGPEALRAHLLVATGA